MILVEAWHWVTSPHNVVVQDWACRSFSFCIAWLQVALKPFALEVKSVIQLPVHFLLLPGAGNVLSRVPPHFAAAT